MDADEPVRNRSLYGDVNHPFFFFSSLGLYQSTMIFVVVVVVDE